MAIQRFSKWRPSAILEFGHSNFLTVRTIKRRMLHSRVNVREARPIHNSDIVSFVAFKMAATAVLDFQKFEILTVCP